jgi:hypothetical protein
MLPEKMGESTVPIPPVPQILANFAGYRHFFSVCEKG